jgi:hypothetical protein
VFVLLDYAICCYAVLCKKVGTPNKAPWHPAATGHRLDGEVLAANYLQIFKRAVVEMDSAAPGITLLQLQVTACTKMFLIDIYQLCTALSIVDVSDARHLTH